MIFEENVDRAVLRQLIQSPIYFRRIPIVASLTMLSAVLHQNSVMLRLEIGL
jgi:hypothetical protein